MTYTREALVAIMQNRAVELGYTPSANDLGAKTKTFYRYFGSLQAAQEAAGLVPNKPRVQANHVYSGWTTSPELGTSLWLLLELEEYSATDVALMFGVSRERVRQWAEKYGITQRGKSRGKGTRIWNDRTNRFNAAPSNLIKKGESLTRRFKKKEVAAKRRSICRAEMIAKIQACKERLGRDPTLVEMCEAVSGKRPRSGASGAVLIGLWGYEPGQKKTCGKLARIREACGVPARPLGTTGHVNRTHKKKEAIT